LVADCGILLITPGLHDLPFTDMQRDAL